MQKAVTYLCYSLIATALYAQTPRTFTNTKGEPLTGAVLTKYNFEDQTAVFEIKRKTELIPLATFCPEDQAYILKWNMFNAFKQNMRFDISLEKNSWKQLRWSQSITPYWMDAVALPGKTTPLHNVIMLEEYEETASLYLEATGYTIILKNKNMFPIDNLVVHHKIFYEQEEYTVAEDINLTDEKNYDATVTTNKSKQATEIIPGVAPLEEITLDSEYAVTVDSQIDRNQLITEKDDESDEDDVTNEVDGFGEWDDSSRKRKGKVIGIWVKVGMKDPDGEIFYREITAPDSLKNTVSWDFDAYIAQQETINESSTESILQPPSPTEQTPAATNTPPPDLDTDRR